MMGETAERENLRDRCERIDQLLCQGHKLLDDLTGPEPATDAVPEPSQSQGMVYELELALDRIDRKARDLALRLEALCKQI